MKKQVRQHLHDLQAVLILAQLWENSPPSEADLASQQPFCIDTLAANQWLQWIFIPRLHAMLDADAPLPTNFAVSPYVEEALKEHASLAQILIPLKALETLLKG